MTMGVGACAFTQGRYQCDGGMTRAVNMYSISTERELRGDGVVRDSV